VLVVRGEPGIGKSALLEYAVSSATGFQIARATGVESEMELPFAGLHQLSAPMLGGLALLPVPQRDAMRAAFGMATGGTPDRFLIGLALLGLLSEASETAPVLCLVDDAQWLDKASTQALAFAARRLFAERVCLVLGARSLPDDMNGFPQLGVQGLSNSDAGALLASVLSAPLDERVRLRVIAEAHGNPLALLEWVRDAKLTGFGPTTLVPVAGQIEEGFRRQVGELPVRTQRFLTLAAAEPTGDPMLLWRAAGRLGVGAEDAAAAIDSGLVEIGARVSFRHPLVRSAAYRGTVVADRRAAHQALAEATDPALDPDRRAWHRAEAAAGPDEDVAVELERSASRARARGGLAAAAAFLERATELTADFGRRAARSLAAAQAQVQAGEFDAALRSLATAEVGQLDELGRAEVVSLRGRIAFASNSGREAPALFLDAARQFEPLDVARARDAYLESWAAALFAGRFAEDVGLYEVARAARSAPRPAGVPRPSDVMLDGFAVMVTEGLGEAAPLLRGAGQAFAESEITLEEGLRWGWAAAFTASMRWDEETWEAVLVRQLNAVREAGLLVHLPIYLNGIGIIVAWRGDLTTASSLIAEADAIAAATGTRFARYAAVLAASLQGSETEACQQIDAESASAESVGQGLGAQWCEFVSAVLYNGHGRYEEALAQARAASDQPPDLHVTTWALAELIEAATRTGEAKLAADAAERLSAATAAAGTDWAIGIDARSRALVSAGETADHLYATAIERLGRTRMRPELARAHLLYGEWLRREKRRVDARQHLRTAHEMLSGMGIGAFAERARRELAATGETVRKRTFGTTLGLTPQEAQIARLAADGRTNPEIGAQLFISAHTVQYHLSKVFTKVGVTSRKQLQESLAGRAASLKAAI
jgi:DNA-binding CsgD family transcriptional regulator